MGDHVRQQIREHVASTLRGLTTSGASVFTGRVYRLPDSKLPALVVFTNTERSEPDTMGTSPGLERVVDLVVEGYAKVTADLDDLLDRIAVEVEEAMGVDRTLNGLAEDCYLTGTVTDLAGEGDKSAGFVQMTYRVEYRTGIDSPDTVLE